MHSKGLNDPIFRSMINDLATQTGDVNKVEFCLRCHAPLTEHVSQRLKMKPPEPFLITSVEKTISVNGGVDP